LQKRNHKQPFGKPALSGSAGLRLNPKLCLHNAVHYITKACADAGSAVI